MYESICFDTIVFRFYSEYVIAFTELTCASKKIFCGKIVNTVISFAELMNIP